MSRLASDVNQNAVDKVLIPYVLFVEFDFPSGSVYCCSGARSYTALGHVYQALGLFGGISDIQEGTDLSSRSITFTLSGVDNALIEPTLAEKYHGKNATLLVGYLDQNEDLIDDPEILWQGVMDVMTLNSTKNGSAVSLVCQNPLVRWQQAPNWLYTQEHQRLFDATDNFFDQVNAISAKSVTWGNAQIRAGAGDRAR